VKRCAGLHTVCGHRRRLVVSKVWTRQCDRSFHANGKLSDACRIQWNDHKRKEGDMLHKHACADIICCGIMPVSVLVHNLHQNGTGRSCPCVERQPETILHRERLVDESEERESRGSVPVADDQCFKYSSWPCRMNGGHLCYRVRRTMEASLPPVGGRVCLLYILPRDLLQNTSVVSSGKVTLI
jgi:hypothetical protein